MLMVGTLRTSEMINKNAILQELLAQTTETQYSWEAHIRKVVLTAKKT